MSRATVTSKGQVTLPKEIREHLGVSQGDRLEFRIERDGTVVVEAETIDVRKLRGIVKGKGKAVSLEAMDEVITQGAARR